MISCKLEQMGERLGLMLDQGQCEALGLHPGDTVRLEVAGDGALRIAETWSEDPHARGRAFLKRLNRRASAQLV
jgi:antitoxin component of MazEF toxin-antitoxin module